MRCLVLRSIIFFIRRKAICSVPSSPSGSEPLSWYSLMLRSIISRRFSGMSLISSVHSRSNRGRRCFIVPFGCSVFFMACRYLWLSFFCKDNASPIPSYCKIGINLDDPVPERNTEIDFSPIMFTPNRAVLEPILADLYRLWEMSHMISEPGVLISSFYDK